MSVVISIMRRGSRPHSSERNKVRAWRKTMNKLMTAGAISAFAADDELDSICLGLFRWQKTSLHSRLKEQNLSYEN